MNKLRTFIRLSSFQKGLLIQAFGASLYTWLLFLFFKKRAGFGETLSGNYPDLQADKRSNDIAWAIHATRKYVPWKNVCRHQAYQAKLLCNFYKIRCLIFIGFKKDKAYGIQAHAWAMAGGKIITGHCNPDDYIVQNIYKNKW